MIGAQLCTQSGGVQTLKIAIPMCHLLLIPQLSEFTERHMTAIPIATSAKKEWTTGQEGTQRRCTGSLMFPLPRISECMDSEAETVMQLRNELRDKEMKLTDIRLEALSSAHQLDQLREAMNRMQVRARDREWSPKSSRKEPQAADFCQTPGLH